MIRLNVFIQVEESNRNEVIEVAKELVAQSLKTTGASLTTFSKARHAKTSL